MAKLLFFQWNSFMNRGVERGLKELEIEYDTCFYQLKDWEIDEKFQEWFLELLRKGKYSRVFSVNFVPLISEVCEEKGICYCSWIYDSPVHFRNLDSMKRSCNRIYLFDRGQVEVYRKRGIPIKYLPLAADTYNFRLNVSARERERYRGMISFVGKLYQTEYNYFSMPLNEHSRGYLEGLINAQSKVYGGYFLDELITEELLEELNKDYRKASSGSFEMGRRELEFMLASEITGRERRIALSLLGKYYPVSFYSGETEGIPDNLHQKGYVDYYSQMPLIFSESKINLNISLKTIRTGMPLRILDIMGSGGFLMSNFQAEIPEYFNIGEEIEVYQGIEDLICKTKFYLEHEEVRNKIAQKGYERVGKFFTFKERLATILSEKEM